LPVLLTNINKLEMLFVTQCILVYLTNTVSQLNWCDIHSIQSNNSDTIDYKFHTVLVLRVSKVKTVRTKSLVFW